MKPRRFTRGWSPSYNYNPTREHGGKIVKEPKSKLEKERDTKKFISNQCLKFGVDDKFILLFYNKHKKADKIITFIFKASKIRHKCQELEIEDKNYYIFLCKNNPEHLDNIIEILNVSTGIFKELRKREIKFDPLDLIKVVKRYNANFKDVYNYFFKKNITIEIKKESYLNNTKEEDKTKKIISKNIPVQSIKIDLKEAHKICEILGIKIEEEQLIEFIKVSTNYNILFNTILNYKVFFKLR